MHVYLFSCTALLRCGRLKVLDSEIHIRNGLKDFLDPLWVKQVLFCLNGLRSDVGFFCMFSKGKQFIYTLTKKINVNLSRACWIKRQSVEEWAPRLPGGSPTTLTLLMYGWSGAPRRVTIPTVCQTIVAMFDLGQETTACVIGWLGSPAGSR